MPISVKEASLLLGGSEGWTRSLCRRHLIGDAWRSTWEFQYHSPGHRMKYEIVPGKLAKYMEISEQELLNRLIVVRESEVR